MLLLILFMCAIANAARPAITEIHGHRTCAMIEGSAWDCSNAPAELPAAFTFETAGNKIKLDWHGCEGRKVRHNFHFQAKSCGVAYLEPQPGKPDQLGLSTAAGCNAYYTCADRR